MDAWRKVWRDSVAPSLPTKGLEKLLIALEKDDPKLVQSATALPYSCGGIIKEEVQSACVVGFCGWQGDELGSNPTSAQIERFVIGVFIGVKDIGKFLDFTDRTDRTTMRTELGKEVQLELDNRKGSVAK